MTANSSSNVSYNVLAIVGFVLAFLVWPAGLIVSIIALVQIRGKGQRGKGLAIAGIIISIVIGVIAIASLPAYFAMLEQLSAG